MQSCKGAKGWFSSPNACMYGCIGLGDCAAVCEHDAIKIVNGVAKVDPALCGACGQCAAACPNQLISIKPKSKHIDVLCSSGDNGKATKLACKNGCIGCKKCEKVCPLGAIKVENNVAVIDYDKCHDCPDFAACAKSCTTGCILIADLQGYHRLKG